ncbi:MAG TPA: hypothetical protein PKM59_11045 [Thermodesulfobacteriota bacterium]|nr:hypothetical protein [Thermodesulfobacteriota bacterium]HNU70371.1 hypothetical protein [Thermodesulfobacteriota bacterium]
MLLKCNRIAWYSFMAAAMALIGMFFPSISWSEKEFGWTFERDGLDAPPDSYYVEQDCVYWVVTLSTPADPSQYYEIRGEYANARFSSFQTYGEISPFDTMYDSQIDPDPGSLNPIRDEVPYPRYRQRLHYTIRLQLVAGLDEIPEERPANTLYAKPRRSDGTYGLIYRVYWNEIKSNAKIPAGYSARQWEKQGQQELPRIFLVGESTLQEQQTAPGHTDSLPDSCLADPLSPITGSAVPKAAGKEDWFAGNTNFPYANAAAGYFMANFDERYGEIVTVRFKAPTFPDTEGGEIIDPDTQQTRYWSVCTHIPQTTTTIDCMSDNEFIIDDGWVTVVISAPDKKPTDVANWLPFGWDAINQRYGAAVIIRHILPSDILLPESPYFYTQNCVESYSTNITGFRSCLNDRSALADFAGEYYPSITCSASGDVGQ